MIVAVQVAFSTTPAMIAFSVALVVAVGLCSGIAWRRSGYRKTIGFLELLRVGIVAATALLLNQPEGIEQQRSAAKPTVVVLVDESASMATEDVVDPTSNGLRSRAAQVEELVRGDVFLAIGEHARVVFEPFGADATAGGQTDLYRPLAQLASADRPARAVVLISDGDWTAGPPPVEGAGELRRAGIPVFAAPIGSREQLPDLRLVSLDAPTFAVAGKPVRIPFTVESSLAEERRIELLLEASDGSEARQQVRIPPLARTSESILWKPETAGNYTLTLTLPNDDQEVRTDNNVATAPIAVRAEQLRVLIVESYPRWEYRYLRNALFRDPGVQTSSLLFHPDLDHVGGGSDDYLSAFPDRRDLLASYDVVFLGDVGVGDRQLTPRQGELLKGLVEHQASGLVFLPGRQGRQQSLLETGLADLYPVVLDPSQPGGVGALAAGHFQLTEAGRRSLLTKLAQTPAENQDIWQSLPGFQWVAPVVRARAGSEVLAVHAGQSNSYGRLPLIVTRTYGAGRVLLMATDGAWRWRMGVEDKYHYRFWGQVVRWMAYQRNMAEGETMRIYYAPDQPRTGRTLTLGANVMTPAGEPLTGGELVARIVVPSGKAETIRFQSTGEQWGAFTGQTIPREPGEHLVTLVCRETGAQLETTISVRGDPHEAVGRPARPEVLEEVARVSGGATIRPEEMGRLAELLGERPDRPVAGRRIQWWRSPAVVFPIVGLLGLFWTLRKAVGLV